MERYQLPLQERRGFCNVFFSAIGGDGTNMAARLLFQVGVDHLGLDGGYDARYGSEKKGTPTDVSVKFCPLGTPVLESGPTDRPHILAIFREGLIEPLALWRGLHPDARVLINTRESPAAMRERVRLHSGRVVRVDAAGIALETGSRLNMPMLALAAEALGLWEGPGEDGGGR